MIVNTNRKHRIVCEFVLSTVVVLLARVSCNLSTEFDYEDDDSNSSINNYYYDEESTVERLSRGSGPKAHAQAELSYMQGAEHFAGPKTVPLYDENGKKLGSQEVYAAMQQGNIKDTYYDSEGKRVTIPILLREKDFREANLTSIIEWIEWLDDIKNSLLYMREKATGCKTNSYEELKGYKSVTQMLQDIENALVTVERCERKLNQQLRDPGKQWNYPSEKEPTAR